jgi:hypothetical protein
MRWPMHRRSFLTLLGSAAAAWPIAASGQMEGRARRVGVLMAFAEKDLEAQARITAFRDGLLKLGWVEGRNLQMEVRWAGPDTYQIDRFAQELSLNNQNLFFHQIRPRPPHCCDIRATYRSCLGLYRIHSAAASSKVFHDQAGTLLVLW